MPPRKSSRLSGSSKQSTLKFNHRVTKNVAKSSAKEIALSDASSLHVLPKRTLKEALTPENDDHKEVQTPEPQEQADEKDGLEAVKVASVPVNSDTEFQAKKLGDAAIERYWRRLEALRMAERVHQEDLSTGEKVLRYFDVSSQFGPCIGIPRIKRWHRANRLGLQPPIEVLAALLKEQAGGNMKFVRAHMDEIMTLTAVGST